VFPISALKRKGLRELVWAAYKLRESYAEEVARHEEPEREYKFEPSFVVEKADDGFVVTGKNMDRLVRMFDFDNEEAVHYFQSRLHNMGVYAALRRAGARPGDRFRIAEFEFPYKQEQ
jgi:GTP-binding protein